MKSPPPKGTVDIHEVLAYLHADCYLDKKKAADYLDISVSNLEKRLKEIPHFRLGQKVLFKRSELDVWMEQFRERDEALDLKGLADAALAQLSDN